MRTFRYRRSGVVGNAETYSQLYAQSVTLSATPRRRRQATANRTRRRGGQTPGRKGRAMDDISEDFARLDDSALLSRRARDARRAGAAAAGVTRPRHADGALRQDNRGSRRPRPQGMDTSQLGAPAVNEPVTAEAAISHLPPRAARMAAIEILLADPASLGDDSLESGLYILREKLRATQ